MKTRYYYSQSFVNLEKKPIHFLPCLAMTDLIAFLFVTIMLHYWHLGFQGTQGDKKRSQQVYLVKFILNRNILPVYIRYLLTWPWKLLIFTFGILRCISLVTFSSKAYWWHYEGSWLQRALESVIHEIMIQDLPGSMARTANNSPLMSVIIKFW